MNTFSILMLALIILGLNVGLIALAVQLGTAKIRTLLERQLQQQAQAHQVQVTPPTIG